MRLRQIAAPEAQHYFQSRLPIRIDTYAFDVDLGREVTKNCFVGRMKREGWSDQQQAGRNMTQSYARKQVVEFAALRMPANAYPIVQGLQGKVDVFVCFQFEHRKLAVVRRTEKVEPIAVAS